MSRAIAFVYGLVSYLLFFVTILYAIGFIAAMLVPKTIDSGDVVASGEAMVVDLLLMALFALQHSVMARKGFKRWWTQFVPPAIERSTYVLLASLTLLLLFWEWRPLPAVIWHVADPQLAGLLRVASLAGWFIVLSSSFLINHFELFGLQQVANHLVRRPMSEAQFRTPLYYKLVRHPLYFGFILAVWATPAMTAGHLLFAAVITAYILLGILLEERDMVALFGDQYRRYQERVPMLLPWRRPAASEDAPGLLRQSAAQD